MTKCSNCESSRIADVRSKARDLSIFGYNNLEVDGYLPYGVGIGGGDYCELSYCLDCGMIQGDFPISDEALCEAFDVDEMPANNGSMSSDDKMNRFEELHEDAVRDIEGMRENEWLEYRQLGRDLVSKGMIPEDLTIK